MMLWAFGLALLALMLFVLEVFVPSHGALTVAAFAAAIAAGVEAYAVSLGFGNRFVIGMCLVLPVAVWSSLRLFPHTFAGRRLINQGLSFGSRPATDERDLGLVGTIGTVLTPLRPAGHAELGGRRVDVVSRGESIEVGVRVRVLEVTGNRVVVVRDGEPGVREPGA